MLDWCLGLVMGSMKVNKPRLNPDKTDVLQVGGSHVQEVSVQSVLDEVFGESWI